MRAPLVLVLLTACSSSGGSTPPPPSEPPPEPAPTVVLPDAAVAEPAAPITSIPLPEPPATRDRRRLQIMLTSTPSDALVRVDGKEAGRTPAYWEGDFTGRPRTFTFEKLGYATSTYSFVPIQDGFVHGRLEKVADIVDGGVL